MKKLLLITFLFLITPDAKADMDYVCNVNTLSSSDLIRNCERNNILHYRYLNKAQLPSMISKWCRHDREIHYIQVDKLSDVYDLTCVLYDNKPRKRK